MQNYKKSFYQPKEITLINLKGAKIPNILVFYQKPSPISSRLTTNSQYIGKKVA